MSQVFWMKIVKSWHASSCGPYDAGGGGFEAAATTDNAVSDGRKTSSDVVVADFNGDGFMDIFVSTVEGTNDLLVNDGKGVFTRAADDPTVGFTAGAPRIRAIFPAPHRTHTGSSHACTSTRRESSMESA